MLILTIGVILFLVSLLLKGLKKYNIWVGFAIVIIIMAFQDNIEGDFQGYEQTYTIQLDSRTADDEPFWSFLNLLCAPLMSFRCFYFLIVVFQVFILKAFVNEYADKKYSWIAPLLFYFTFNMMLIQMKAIRQGLAVELCLFSFYLMDKTKLWKAVIPAVLGYLTHNSALITFPLLVVYKYFLITPKNHSNNRKKQNEWFWPIFMVFITFSIYLLKTYVLNNYILALATLFSDGDFRLIGYLNETDADINLSNVMLLYNMFLVGLASWYYQTASKFERIMCLATIVASYMEILFFGMGSLFRMGLYFSVFSIVLVPNILNKVGRRYGSWAAFMLSIFFVLYAIKTSLPWLMSSEPDRFGGYRFVL